MNAVWVVNAETVTALGDSFDALWQGLLSGHSAIGPVDRFKTTGSIDAGAACIPDLAPKKGDSLIHAVLDRLLERTGSVPVDARLLTATTKAGIDNLERIRHNEPAAIGDLLLNSLAGMTARKLGLTDSGTNISAACASSTIAVARAAGLISTGRADAVLVLCLDVITQFVFSGFACLKVISPFPTRPFDRRRAGMSLGDGAAALLLMSAERARREKRHPLGRIRGWGVANDAAHITAPARDGCGLVSAIKKAFKVGRVQAEDITAINAHGTGTVYNDLMELVAIERLFGSRALPVHSVKGAIGHTLGAAGGIEVAVGLKSLEEQLIPPTAGFQEPEKGAEKCVSAEVVNISGNYLLSTNSGFGGVNAALIIERSGEL